ncbi:hypothetical protein B0T18DRAFT_33511 [Schizothecium vesticola]|uniref:Uncharacterized protein n=1 Tax=Schizothecium vesticola TaxID=314040 RepID=A0AA40KCY4_9PEZI|nr:hypothetical protein B0T18DRAFT_33511 [Schizothecium vesticola]
MENSSIPRSLTILTRSSETKESHDSMRRESSIPVEDDSIQGEQSLASSVTRVNTWPTHSLLFIPPSSRPSTPPPDDISPSQIDLIHGVGDHFPNIPLSRASTLSVNSGYEASISSLGRRSRTSDREADSDEEDLDTPRALQDPWTGSSFMTPARTITTRDCIVVQLPPDVVQLTPDLTPRPLKRGTSPLSTPRPAKRSRLPPPQEPLSASLALQEVLRPPTERSATSFSRERLQGSADVEIRPVAPDDADTDGNHQIPHSNSQKTTILTSNQSSHPPPHPPKSK